MVTSDSKDRFDLIKQWLLAKHPERRDISDDIDLIENEIIDSLSFVDFIFTVESASGCSIDVESINIDHFRSLAAIKAEYFGG